MIVFWNLNFFIVESPPDCVRNKGQFPSGNSPSTKVHPRTSQLSGTDTERGERGDINDSPAKSAVNQALAAGRNPASFVICFPILTSKEGNFLERRCTLPSQ